MQNIKKLRKKGAAKTTASLEKRQRREQQRAIDSRQKILRAALSEFAEKGFDAASIRNIGERAGVRHPLITFYYPTKDVLWQMVAEHFLAAIHENWQARLKDAVDLSPKERVREAFRALFEIQQKFPDIHHFMLRESRPGSPRLAWLAHTILTPMANRLLPQIRLAQASNDLPEGEAILVHYMMIGMTSALASLGAEMTAVTGLVADKKVADAYLDLIERVLFRGTAKHTVGRNN